MRTMKKIKSQGLLMIPRNEVQMTLDNIKEEILNSQNIVILTHEVPDGDAIGSSLAMYMGLKQIGTRCRCCYTKIF